MASSHHKGSGHSVFMNKSPHFFKIILQETLRDGKLGIPKEFIKKYGNGMLTPAVLRVPSGEVWEVELRKIDGKVWLKNGWQEFSNHYSLKQGHFLVFTYEGNCNFHVVILDRTASEIEYPCTSYHARFKEIPEESETEDDDSAQIFEDNPPNTKSGEKMNFPCTRPQKKMRSTDSANITECDLKSECLTPQDGCPTITGDNRALALRRAATAYKSDNPFFVIVMQPSYVGLSTKCKLVFPTDFVRKHLIIEDCEIILCNSEGKTWPVHFHRAEGKRLYASLQAGWDTFLQDNSIQLGDICAFELINCIEISFKVVKCHGGNGNFHDLSPLADVFVPVKKNARGSSPSQRQSSLKPLDALQKAEAIKLASAFRSENPSFAIVMQPSYINSGKLSVPEKFARKYFRKMQPRKLYEIVLRMSNGKSWPVKYYQQSIERPSAKLCSGWKTFALVNNLEVGNVCIFELTGGSETSFKVTIYRKQSIEDANLGLSCAGSGTNEGKIECNGSSEINAKCNPLHNKGDMCGLQNHHLAKDLPVQKAEENSNDVSGEILDDFWLPFKTKEDKSESPRPILQEAAQLCRTSQDKDAIQDTNRQD